LIHSLFSSRFCEADEIAVAAEKAGLLPPAQRQHLRPKALHVLFDNNHLEQHHEPTAAPATHGSHHVPASQDEANISINTSPILATVLQYHPESSKQSELLHFSDISINADDVAEATANKRTRKRKRHDDFLTHESGSKQQYQPLGSTMP
jgi:hypothetical protein